MLSEISQMVRDKYHMISPLTGTESTKEKSNQNITRDIDVKNNLTVAKFWEQPKCPSANEWITKNGTFTQWNSMQQRERRSLYPLQQYRWNWRALC